MKKRTLKLVALTVMLTGWPLIGLSQDAETVDEAAYIEQFLASLSRQTGDIVLGDQLATLSVPSDYYFLDAEDAANVLVGLWGNPPEAANVLGMLFPARYTPVDQESWAVTIEYSEDGYVSDEDAAKMDYDDLLRQMQADTRAGNEARSAAGYGSVELLGWAEPPHYDSNTKKLYWAKEIQFEGNDTTTLNYDIRALGRKGVLSMTFIANTSQLSEINRERETVLAMAEFNEGMRYEDFDPSMDKVAAYGIGALVAGKVAAKTGFLAAAILFLKKFGVFLLIGLAALGKKIFGLFGGRKGNASENLS